jgi:adsorption protein A
VLIPHVALITRYDNALAIPRTVGIGPGVSLRHWFREDTYAAPRYYIEAIVQYRFKIGGGDRVKGLLAGISISY